MARRELFEVLSILYDAGARDVPAEALQWTKDMVPALHAALNMQYVKRRETPSGVRFSLTKAGYEAIGERAPAYMSLASTFGLIFGFRRR